MRRRIWVCSALTIGGLFAGVVAAVGGCSSSSSPSMLNPGPGRDSGPGGGGDTGVPPQGDGASTTMTLYQRLGGHPGIRTAIDNVVAAELQDSQIASYFVFQGGAPANGHPTADQIEECFTDLVGSLPAVGGPETYPTTVTTDAGAFTCRSMMTIHQPLLISGGTFDAFILIAGTSLQAQGVSTADLATLAQALEATKPQIVDPSLADAGKQQFTPDAGASD